MGLALVEFVMTVEEEFKIVTRDEVAERIRAPNDLVDYILLRLPSAPPGPCPTQCAFHALRRAGMKTLRRTRARFRPQTMWTELIPPRERSWRWRALGRDLDARRWPALRIWNRFPRGMETVGAAARWLSSAQPARFPAFVVREGIPASSRRKVKAGISRIMAEMFELSDFDWDASFINDLGLD